MPHWPMDMAPLWVALAQVAKRSICFSDPTKLLFLCVMMRIILFPVKISMCVLHSLLMDPTTSDM